MTRVDDRRLDTDKSPLGSLEEIQVEIVQGLRSTPKKLPTKLFYDQRGSELFDQICELKEYYPTRTETEIMRKNIDEIAMLIGKDIVLVEYGSGSSLKTRLLLENLTNLQAYVPVDISQGFLYQTVESLKQSFPHVQIVPISADFTGSFSIPLLEKADARRVAYFPGSTLGNFHPPQAVSFLRSVAQLVGSGGGLLIGIDLQKAPEVLNLAYNDEKGVTAAFNLNILRHINRICSADFVEDRFEHLAFYNEQAERIEMHLVSKQPQDVSFADAIFHFREGEEILTEVSYKYTHSGFAVMAAQAGFRIQKTWEDKNDYFSVQYLIAE
jgi:dimethylhistidine N-methyltransferase